MANRLIIVGFAFWTFTLMAGAIWAERAWGRYWGWDTKEVWTFIIWVVFAGYIHARATRGWRGNPLGLAGDHRLRRRAVQLHRREPVLQRAARLLGAEVALAAEVAARSSGSRRCAPPGGRARAPRRGARAGAGVGLDAAHRDRAVARDERLAPSRRRRAGRRCRARSRTRAREARPRAPRPSTRPTEVSSALDTTTGRPASAAMRSAAATPPSGCAFSTRRSAAPARATAQRVVGLAHALVRRDRQRPVVQAGAQLGELGDGRARLLEVLEVVRVERVGGALGLVDVPAAVGIDADATLRPQERARRAHPGHVIRQHLSALGDLHLDGARAGESGEHAPRPRRGATAGSVALTGMLSRTARGRRAPAEVDRRREPGRRLGVVVLDEGRELGPAVAVRAAASPRACSMPRNRVTSGRATTCAPSSSSATVGDMAPVCQARR